jgi:hypothetical protein
MSAAELFRSRIESDKTQTESAQTKPTLVESDELFKKTVTETNELEMPTETIDFNDLYPFQEFSTPELSTGLKLLAEAIREIDASIEHHNAGDEIGADDAIQRLQVLLPELFCCRSIGDGYAMVINAVQAALDHSNGTPVTLPATIAVGQAFRVIRNEPFISSDAAVDLLMRLEDTGLSIEPRGFEVLKDWLSA